MEEYRSPFRLPVCPDPEEADKYPYTHNKTGKCPVHFYEDRDKDRHWRLWYEYRERYATSANGEEGDAAREVLMRKLLNQVTASNPPDAPVVKTRGYETSKRRLDYWLVLRGFLVAVVAVEVIVSVLVALGIL